MKKKLLPFILGCAMVAAMPLGAHANLSTNTTVEYANEIPTSGSIAGGVAADESQNGFTEYNNGAGADENTLAKVFTNSDKENQASGLGNTRNSANTMQGLYTVTKMNEQSNYRKTAHSLGDDLNEAASVDPDVNDFSEQTNDTAGTTDLETSVPEFEMKIPADTVLPLGATKWRIGNVEINGKYFVRPDKVQVVTTHNDFKHSTYDDSPTSTFTPADLAARKIVFTVTDSSSSSSSIEGVEKFYFQDGSGHKQTAFPYAYEEYTSEGYRNGFVSEINETHQVWVKSTDWTGKIPGKYTGNITFAASVVTTEPDTTAHTNEDMYENYYPGE